MENNKQSFDFTFFSENELEEKFKSVIQQCEGLECHQEIQTIINRTFFNRQLQIITFDSGPDLKVYRVTKVYRGFDPEYAKSFSYPPNPHLGRANIAGEGNSVFYGSLIPATALREMKENLKTGEELYISEWNIKSSKNVLIHTVLNNSITENNNVFASLPAKDFYIPFDEMLENFPEENKRLKCFFKKMGDLFTLEDKYYHITSAYAHEVLFDARRKGAHIAMIMYPSVACNHNGINLAIHPSFVDGKLMSLNKVIKLKITRIDESSIEVSVMEKGNPKENSTIEWKKPTISIETIHYEEINMGTYNDQTFQGENALSLSINKKSKKFGDHIKSVIDKMNLIDCLLQIPFKDDVIEFEFARRKYLMILQYNKGIQVKIDGRYDDVKYIALPITYTDDYR